MVILRGVKCIKRPGADNLSRGEECRLSDVIHSQGLKFVIGKLEENSIPSLNLNWNRM